MIDHVWTVYCSNTVIDRETNNVSIFNIIEELAIKDAPKPDGVIGLPTELVTLWVRSEPEEPAVGLSRMSFLSPSGESLISLEYEIDLKKSERLRYRIHLQQIPLRESGRHKFLIELKTNEDQDWQRVSSIPFIVKFQPAEVEKDVEEA